MNIIYSIGKKSTGKLLSAVLITAVIFCTFSGCGNSVFPTGSEPSDYLPTLSPQAAKSGARGPVPTDAPINDNRYVILWDTDVSVEAQHAALETLSDFTVVSEFDEHYTVVRNTILSRDTILSTLRALPGVKAVDPDYLISLESFSNDYFADSQWSLDNPGVYKYYFNTDSTDPILLPTREDIDINFPEARDLYNEIIASPREVVIAVIDTGVDITHPELKDSVWTNPGEIPGDGIDNDGNGYIDDINGWDFYNSDNTVIHLEKDGSGNFTDNDTHGTQVAGIIAAASGNGAGISGAASFVPVKIMSLKINGGADGYGSVSSAIKAINYATEMGADICNMSWGSSSISSTLDTLEAAMKTSDMLFVCAAGNTGTDNDLYPVYPANIRLPNSISVTFLNEVGKLVERTVSADGKSYGSNYGKNSVDVATPGTYILTTSPAGGYSAPSGSSMAAPFVTAIAAMLMSTQENLFPSEIKNLILSSCKTAPADMVTPTPIEGDVSGTPTPEVSGTPGEPTGTPVETTGTPAVTPGAEDITGTPTEPPTNTPVPTPSPDPSATPEPSPSSTGSPESTDTPEATATPHIPSGPFEEAPEVTGSVTQGPTPEPTGPVNPFLALEGRIRTIGIPDMYKALLESVSLSQDTDIPSVTISRTFDKSMILLDVQGYDAISGARVIRYVKETADTTHDIAFFRRGIGGTAFTGPLKLARPGIYSFYVSDYAGNESVIRYEILDDVTAPEIRLLTTLKSPSGTIMTVLDVSDYESGLNAFSVLSGSHPITDFTASGSKATKLKPVDSRLMLRFTDTSVITLYATDYRGNVTLYEITVPEGL